MIRSVAHPSYRNWHKAHRARARRSWAIVAALTLATVLGFVLLGYLSKIGWGELGIALLRTLYRLALAYGIALLLGVTIALLVGWSPWIDAFFPFFDVLQNIPSFALIPIFIYFLGYGDLMIILFAVSSIIWPILFAVLTAIKSAHSDLADAAEIFGARGYKRVLHYLAPLSYPAIVTGSIVGVAIGWESVIGAEIIAGSGGFGAFIKSAGATGINPTTIAGTLAILVVVFVINRLIWAPLLSESTKRYAE
jgi:NitT/TauT family transport system permease protein